MVKATASSFSVPVLVQGLILLHLGLAPFVGVAQPAPSITGTPQITFHSSSDLVLVDVIALKKGLPDKTLTRGDFQVFDNGHPASIKTFDSGTPLTTRPLALWFVVQCRMEQDKNWRTSDAKGGSDLFRGQIRLFKPALKYVDKQDSVAVAHWCDNGDSRLDLLPTRNVEQLATTLEQVLAPTTHADDHERTGELALQKTLQLIIDATRSPASEPVPVVIFLYGDHSGMPRSEADHFIDELLETSAVAYGLKDRRSPQVGWLASRLWSVGGEQAAIADYIAAQTGGQYLWVTPKTYADGLEEILRQLHFRYQLGFQPKWLDGKRHNLTVRIAGRRKGRHKGVRLRYRAAYVPTRRSPGFAGGPRDTVGAVGSIRVN